MSNKKVAKTKTSKEQAKEAEHEILKKVGIGILDDEDDDLGKIVSKLEMKQLMLKDKTWTIQMKIETVLPESYRRYHVLLELDERNFDKRIKELEKELDDSLFREERRSRAGANKAIAQINNERLLLKRDCKPIEFNCVVEQVKYVINGTVLTANIPDDVIDALNKQKYRMEAYKITLEMVHF